MFDDLERKILGDLFGSDTPMYMHRLADYAAMFEAAGDTIESRRERAEAFLGKLGVLDDVIARDSSERPFEGGVETAILGAGAWAENMSGGAFTRIAPAPGAEIERVSGVPCTDGGPHSFQVTCSKCGVSRGAVEG